jgi:D-alanyl-D-alanine carboxypeptidase (penicillin-binding protein 5/6)
MKRKKRLLSLPLLVCFLFSAPHAAAYNDLPEVDVQARSAILVHAQTDEILFAHNAHIRREPASVTKIMTVLLALEHGDPDDVVIAEEEDFFDIHPQSSTAGIRPGEEMTLRDLLYCAMLPSANEACNIIARHIAGSVPAFMEMVNARLADIGCENTSLTNTHGLPDPPSDVSGRVAEHYTTAYDVYLMARECLNNAAFMEIAYTEHIVLPPTNMTPEGRALTTTNNLITRRRTPEYYYPPARGIKTGRTNDAGYCLLSVAERDGVTLISVVLGASMEEETGLVRSFTETRDLFEWGFENFTIKRILSRVDKLTRVDVSLGKEDDHIFLVPERSMEALVPSALNPEEIDRQITVFEPEGIRAPVEAGDVLGEVSLSYQGRDYGTVPLVADRSVEMDAREAIQDEVGNIIDKIFGTPSGEEDDLSGSLQWIKWAALGAGALILLYVAFVIMLNRRRRKRNMRSSNYRGKRRY